MRINENMNMMRNHIASIAQKNIKSQRKIQEVRNQRLFGTEPVYTIADMMDDISEMNQEQFNWFYSSINEYDRVRFQGIFEQVSNIVESYVDFASQDDTLTESAQEYDFFGMLIEDQSENIKKVVAAYKAQLAAVPAGDTQKRQDLQRKIQGAEARLSKLQAGAQAGKEFATAKKASTGTSASGKPKFGSAADAAAYASSAGKLQQARADVARGKVKPVAVARQEGESETRSPASAIDMRDRKKAIKSSIQNSNQKLADVQRQKKQDTWETEKGEKVSKTKSPWGEKPSFKSDYEKHRDLMLGPAGEGLKYYAKRAKEIGKNVVVGGAKAADAAIKKGYDVAKKGAASGAAGAIAGIKAAGRAVGLGKLYRSLANRAAKP